MADTVAPPRRAKVDHGHGYDEEFLRWTDRQAALIRVGQLDPVRRGRSKRRLQDGPSLRGEVADLARDEDPTAREAAAAETGFAARTFQTSLPDTAAPILDEGSLPGPIDER